MLQILEFIVRACGFLFVDNRYKFVDSAASSSFGGNACVVLQSTALKVRFVRDRGQLFLDFQAPSDRSASSWYSIVNAHEKPSKFCPSGRQRWSEGIGGSPGGVVVCRAPR
jgi:hypothetical protein